MPGGNFLSEFLLLWFGEGDWEWERDRAGHDFCCSGFWRRGNGICRCRLLLRLCVFIRKKGREMGLDCLACFDGETRDQRIQVSIGIDLCRIGVEFLAPHQLCLLTLLHNGLKEATEDLDAIAFTDAGEARMI